MVEALLQVLKQPSLGVFVQKLLEHKQARVWICGNGGSAATAVHFASDLACLGFDVVCLNENVCRLTALTNDYCWEEVYVRQMKYFRAGDVLLVVSVHGGEVRSGTVWSCNLLKACQYTKLNKGVVLALLGGDGGMIGKVADVSVIVPHTKPWAVEGIHCVLAHLVCEGVRQP